MREPKPVESFTIGWWDLPTPIRSRMAWFPGWMFFEQRYYFYRPPGLTPHNAAGLLRPGSVYTLLETELIWKLRMRLQLLTRVEGLELWELNKCRSLSTLLLWHSSQEMGGHVPILWTLAGRLTCDCSKVSLCPGLTHNRKHCFYMVIWSCSLLETSYHAMREVMQSRKGLDIPGWVQAASLQKHLEIDCQVLVQISNSWCCVEQKWHVHLKTTDPWVK